MGSPQCSRMIIALLVLLKTFSLICATEVCSNTILPGSKGDQGERGDEGDQGRLGKAGPPGQRGLRGELGTQGDIGQMGKVGPAGAKGDRGIQGVHGSSGLKGKPGSTCDCGRYRKVVGQLDINISKLKNAVKFMKNGIKETEEKFYLIVKEARKFKDAQMNCKLRGGALAAPETEDTNTLIARYITQAGLTHVFIGLRGEAQDGTDLDDARPQNYTAWAPSEPRDPSAKDGCVQMSSTGAWSQVECDVTMYHVCEFLKRKRAPPSVL